MLLSVSKRLVERLCAMAALAVATLALSATNAAAVPAFAAQTGEPCQACHIGGFGPQLTPFGREFKLQGYTLRTNDKSIPLSVMAVASYLRTQKAQNPPPTPFNANDNWALDQVSLFFAGGFGQHLGAFVQGTYDGVAQAWHWDNLDLRATTTVKVHKADVTLGASLNNSPTVQDAWNTLPAWGYPYTTSTLAPTPATSPLLNGALAQTSLGLTGYAWINSKVYLEGGAYWSPNATALSRLGVDPTSPGSISGVAPYGRVAFQQDIGKSATLEVGAFGLQSDIYPGLDHTTGFTDSYTDVGLDASFVDTLANSDVLTINGRLVHERERLAATCTLAGGDQTCFDNTVNDVHVDASYYWRDKIGFTVGAFDTTGSANPILYAGNRTLRPDSTGVLLQLDATPWGDGKSPLGKRFNTRVGIQYTAYTRINGARDNWDGAGSNAADNNALRLFIWSAY